MARRARGTSAQAVFVALVVAASALLVIPSAQAQDYASDCANPTQTFSGGGSQSLDLTTGQTLLLTGGTFTGGSNSFPTGSAICVDASATLIPPYLNNAAGSIFNQGTVTFPSIAVSGTFLLENEGTANFAQGLNTNGPARFDNRATLTVGKGVSISGGASLVNTGTTTVNGAVNLNSGTVASNGGTVVVHGNFDNNGAVTNAGTFTIDGALTGNGGSSVTNLCRLTVGGNVSNNGALTNSGVISATNGKLQNNGQLRQSPTGGIFGRDFGNDRSVSGFGSYRFTGATGTQGTFVGDTAVTPIVFDDRTPTGSQIFDIQNGTIGNVVKGNVPVPPSSFVPPECAVPPTTTADLVVTKTGPATVVPGGTVTYTVTVANTGPASATDVVATDVLPDALSNATASGGGVVGSASVVWTIGTLVSGSSRVFTVSGTAPASGSLTDVVSGTSSGDDPDASNNDGSSPAARVITKVLEPPPVNHPPVVGDVSVGTVVGVPVDVTVPTSDPDIGQFVTVTLDSAPAFGTATVDPTGTGRYTPTGSFVGRDHYTVQACDNGRPKLCDTATITVVVRPIAADVAEQTPEDTPIDVDVLRNSQGDVGHPTVAAGPSHGMTAVLSNGTIRYSPASGFVGSDLFKYRICSTQAADVCDEAVVTIDVLAPANNPPVILDLSLATIADTPVSGPVAATDPDPGQTLTYTVASQPPHGAAAVDADGTVLYTPDPAFTGRDTFTVKVCDNGSPSLCATGTVTVDVSPVANDDAARTTAGTPVDIDIQANDAGEVALPTIVTPPAQGTASVNPDGTVTYAPLPPAFTGTVTFTYRVCSVNVSTLCASATVTVDVDALPNHDPVLGDVIRTTIVGFPVAGTLVASDPDPGQTLTYSLVGAPTHGTATVTPGGRYLYTQTDSYVGDDHFTVQVCDNAPTPGCTTAQVTIRLLPLALPDLRVIDVNGSVALDPRANDLGDLAAATALAQPAHGTAAVTGTELRYTADTNFSGLDSFPYRVCGTGTPTYCAQSRVFVVVRPVLVADVETTFANVAVRADVEANDLGTLGAPKIIRGATHGTATVGHSIDYVPDPDYTGYDRVTYSRCSTGASFVCGVTTLTIRVLPLLNDDVATTTENTAVTMQVSHNDEGVAGHPTIVGPPSNGTAVVQSNGTVVYTPGRGFTGIDVYAYQRCSTNAPDLCSYALGVINVLPAATPPPAGGGELPDTGGGQGLPYGLLGLALLAVGAALVSVRRRDEPFMG